MKADDFAYKAPEVVRAYFKRWPYWLVETWTDELLRLWLVLDDYVAGQDRREEQNEQHGSGPPGRV